MGEAGEEESGFAPEALERKGTASRIGRLHVSSIYQYSAQQRIDLGWYRIGRDENRGNRKTQNDESRA